MLHAGLDLSRRKLDVCLLSASGELVEQLAPAPDADALRTIARRIDEVYGEPVCSVTWSMTGARLVHDTLEQEGWDVEIADAQKVKGAGAAGLQDRQDRLAGTGRLEPARPGAGDLAPDPWMREERELARFVEEQHCRRPLLLVVQASVWSDGPSALATRRNGKPPGRVARSAGALPMVLRARV
jgi:transposase